MKKLVFSIFAILLLGGFTAEVSSAKTAVVMDDGKVVNNRTLVPLRSIFEELGATVKFDQNSKTVTATKGTTTVSLKIGSKSTKVNGKTLSIDVPAQVIKGKMFVPLRFISESLGATVSWNKQYGTAIIESTDKVLLVVAFPNPGIADDWEKYYTKEDLKRYIESFVIGGGQLEYGNVKKDYGVNWSQYENERFGFKVKFPLGWPVGAGPTNEDGMVLYEDKNNSIIVYGSKSGNKIDRSNSQAIKLKDGTPAYLTTDEKNGRVFYAFDVTYNGVQYVFAADVTKTFYQKNKELMDEMIDSFKVLK
ncbi:copper amine oxidase N-terminal domain-containing protein [Ureibacillus sinduriensis]|uniref:copper amine oxidase N-terminal domain-containing protein n=1 Tax=Ureibacillus sinduriensis TaxID=561440 RepID=UPI0009FBF829|nr:copper amine oxidase N-terminal domain-containing protein [Ureibacillus sinduriensis]